jgi:hypothetical protein
MHRKLLILALACALPAFAQQPANLEPLPEPPPPPPGMAEDDFEPEVTIVKRGEDTVEEYRIRGRLYMMKVTPPHGTPYYLIDQRGNGQFVRAQEAVPTLSVPMWVIHSW